MSSNRFIFVWFCCDLCLVDYFVLIVVVNCGGLVIFVYIFDLLIEVQGVVFKMCFEMFIEVLVKDLGLKGSKLILCCGDLVEVLVEMVNEIGVDVVYWLCFYWFVVNDRDVVVKFSFKDQGVDV